MADGPVALVVLLGVVSIAVGSLPDHVVGIGAHCGLPGSAAVIVVAGVLEALTAVVGVWNCALEVVRIGSASSGQPGDLMVVIARSKALFGAAGCVCDTIDHAFGGVVGIGHT